MSTIFRSVPGGQKEERTPDFIRYSTVDRPPIQSPPLHSSGEPYKYRERYAIKTRSRLIQHEKPDVYKQYVWKPPKENTESPNNAASTSTSTGPSTSNNVGAASPPPKKKQKSTPKKNQLAAENMTKFQLVKAMQLEHPLRTLDIGTLKANTSRALKKEVHNDDDLKTKLQAAVTTCLSDVSRLASNSKRGCQQAVGQYLENLSFDELDDDDKIILSCLTSPFSIQEIAAAKKGVGPEAEDGSSDDDDPVAGLNDKDSSVGFFSALLVAIYKASTPGGKMGGAAAAARLFLHKAKAYLPPKTGMCMFASCKCGSDETCCKTKSLILSLSSLFLSCNTCRFLQQPLRLSRVNSDTARK